MSLNCVCRNETNLCLSRPPSSADTKHGSFPIIASLYPNLLCHNMTKNPRNWSSQRPCFVRSLSRVCVSEMWFTTEPFDSTLLNLAAQLQLVTDSYDQGWVTDRFLGAWNWFELVILKDKKSTKPIVAGGKELAWHSHTNRPQGSSEANGRIVRYFGLIFDCRHEL
jgi:hypothetical protein